MNKFRTLMWFVGVLLVSVSLVISFLTRNWLLAIVCAGVTFVLKSKIEAVKIPRVYSDNGITNKHFVGSGKYEKNNQ